jgi:hypothetical protein
MRISTATLHAILTVAILHGLVTLGMLAHLRGHWGWYGSLVLTIGTIAYIGTLMEARHTAATAAQTDVLTRIYR